MVGPLLDRFPIEQVQTYWTPDGEFPDHEPNPLLEENRRFIIDKVRGEGADLGIAWDGDADRCFFIDDTGEFVDGDFLTALLAESLLRKEPGATVLYDVRASRAVPDLVAQRGGTRAREPRGPRLLQDAACARPAPSSAARCPATTTSATSTAPTPARCRRCSCSSCCRRRASRSASCCEPLRERYFISGEINSEVEDQDAKMREIEERYSSGEVSWLDGVSVDFDDWHFNVRPSNTEPLLRLNLESLVSARAHGREARRGARAHPRLASAGSPRRAAPPWPRPSSGRRSPPRSPRGARASALAPRRAARARPPGRRVSPRRPTRSSRPRVRPRSPGRAARPAPTTIGTPKPRLWTIERPTVSRRDARDRRRVEPRAAARSRSPRRGTGPRRLRRRPRAPLELGPQGPVAHEQSADVLRERPAGP